MKAFLYFGYPDIGQTLKGYYPAVQQAALAQIGQASKETYRQELFLFGLVWSLRLYWLAMVLWFFMGKPHTELLILTAPLLSCSFSLAVSLGLIMRSGSLLHAFFAVSGVLVAGLLLKG